MGATCSTGPKCPPDSADKRVKDHSSCIDSIDKPDLGDIPELPGDVTQPKAPGIDDITEVVLDGAGAFDIFMRAGAAQLQSQYDAGRIKGADYASAYIQMMELMMTQAVAFIAKKFEIETSAALFESQYFKAAFDALTAKYAAGKMIADSHLTMVQACELPLNGAADRILKEEQAKTQAKSVDLYDRQIKGYDEKHLESVFKTTMDAWAAQGVEIIATQADSELEDLKRGKLNGKIDRLLNSVGIR